MTIAHPSAARPRPKIHPHDDAAPVLHLHPTRRPSKQITVTRHFPTDALQATFSPSPLSQQILNFALSVTRTFLLATCHSSDWHTLSTRAGETLWTIEHRGEDRAWGVFGCVFVLRSWTDAFGQSHTFLSKIKGSKTIETSRCRPTQRTSNFCTSCSRTMGLQPYVVHTPLTFLLNTNHPPPLPHRSPGPKSAPPSPSTKAPPRNAGRASSKPWKRAPSQITRRRTSSCGSVSSTRRAERARRR